MGAVNLVMDESTTKQIIERYKKVPRKFSQPQVDLIKRHATAYKIPFAEDEQTWVDHVGGVVKQAVTGYISGFTTLNIGGEPQTPAEKISRATGSLAGFIGLLPGLPMRALGIATKVKSIEQLGVGLGKASGKYSIPLMLAEGLMKKGKQMFSTATVRQATDGSRAISTALNFLKSPEISSTLERSMRLGLASGISSWQGGVDAMMKSFAWGASGGAIDATLGNYIKLGSKVSETVVKGLAGAISDGLPATLRGDTTPEQIYYYLRGAYFGSTEQPWEKRYAAQKVGEWWQKGGDPEQFAKDINMPLKAQKLFKAATDQMVNGSPMNYALRNVFGADWQKQLDDMTPEQKEVTIADFLKQIGQTAAEGGKISAIEGGEAGRGNVEPWQPTIKRIEHAVEEMKSIWQDPKNGKTSFEVRRIMGQDLMKQHLASLDTAKQDPNNRNAYTDSMEQYLKGTYFDGKDIQESVMKDIYAIARDSENQTDRVYYVPIFDRNNKTVSITTTSSANNKDPNGKLIGERVSPTLFEQVTGETLYALDNLYYAAGKKSTYHLRFKYVEASNPELAYMKKTDPMFNELPKLALEIPKKLWGEQGRYEWGSNHAKTDVLFAPLHKLVMPAKDNPDSIGRMFNESVFALSKSKKFNPKQKSHLDLMKEITAEMAKDTVYNLDQQKAIMVSNMLYEINVQYGKVSGFQDALKYFTEFADDADIPKTSKGWVKRNQLVLSAGSPMSHQFLRELVGKYNPLFNDFRNVRLVIVDDQDKSLYGAYNDIPIGSRNAGGYTGSTDGGVLMFSPLFDPISKHMGQGTGTGIVKAVGAYASGADGQSMGTMLYKPAIHNAGSPDTYKLMNENGLMFVITKSAAKHIGMYANKVIDVDTLMSGDIKKIQDAVVEMPWESWRVNTGISINETKAHKDQRMPAQSLSHMSGAAIGGDEGKEISANISRFIGELRRRNSDGDAQVNKTVENFLSTTNAVNGIELGKQVLDNIDRVGKKYLWRLIDDDRDFAISNKLIVKLIDSDLEDLNDARTGEDGISDEDYEAESRLLIADSQAATKALYANPDNARSLFYNPLTKEMASRIVNNHIKKAATRPRIDNALYLPLAPYHWWAHKNDPIMSQLNVPVDPTKGETYKFFLGMSDRSKKLTYSDGTTDTLGNIWDRVNAIKEYNKLHALKQKAVDPEDAELLRMVGIRTPQGHPISAIVMELGGFDKNPGHRIYVHPDVAVRLGGADFDADTLKLYTGSFDAEDGTFHGMNKQTKDSISKFDRLAYVKKGDKHYNLDPKDPNYTKNYEQGTVSADDPLNNPALMFTHGMRKYVQETFVQGRGYLAQFANGQIYLEEAMEYLASRPDESYKTTIYKGKDKFTISYKLKDAESRQDALRANLAALSMSVDVSEFNRMKPTIDVLHDVYKRAFEIKIVPDKDNENKYNPQLDDPGLIVYNGLFRAISKAKQAMYGSNRNMNREWTSDEMKAMLDLSKDIYDGRSDTILGAARSSLLDADFGIRTINSQNAEFILEQYTKYDRNSPTGYSKNARGGNPVKLNADARILFEKRLWDPNERTRIIDNLSETGWTEATQKKVLNGQGKYWKTPEQLKQLLKNRFYRSLLVFEQHRASERFVLNDLYDMVSAKLEEKYIAEVPKNLRPKIRERVAFAAERIRQKDAQIRNVGNFDLSAKERNMELDEYYMSLKSALTPPEQKLLDVYLLSSERYGYKGQTLTLPGTTFKATVSSSDADYGTKVDALVLQLNNIPAETIKEYGNEFEALISTKKTVDEIGIPLKAAIDTSTKEGMVEAVLANPSMLRSKSQYTNLVGIEEGRIADLVDRIMPFKLTEVKRNYFKTHPEDKILYNKEYLPEVKKLRENFIKHKLADPVAMNGFVRGMVGKDINAISLNDTKALNKAFEYIDSPTLLVRLFSGSDVTSPVIKRIYTYLFPSEIGTDINRFALQTKEVSGFWVNKYGAQFSGTVVKPTSTIEDVGDILYVANELSSKVKERLKSEYKDKLRPYMYDENYDALVDIAITFREYKGLLAGIRTSDLPHVAKMELTDKINANYEQARKSLQFISSKFKTIATKIPGVGGDNVVPLTPKQIVDNINDIQTDIFRNIYTNMIQKNDVEVSKYAVLGKNGQPLRHFHSNLYVIDKKRFYADMQKAFNEKREWGTKFGIDGLREINHSILYQQRFGKITTHNAKQALAFLKLADGEAMSTGKWEEASYFPHRHEDRDLFFKDIKQRIAEVEQDKSMSGATKEKWISKLMKDYLNHGTNLEDEIGYDMLHRNYALYTAEVDKIKNYKDRSEKELSYLNGISRSGNQKKREFFSLGYDKSFSAVDKYIDSITDTYYKNMSQSLSRIRIADFATSIRKEFGDETGEKWQNFLHLYAQGAAGYGVTIPDRMLQDPKMKLKGTLYAAYSDSNVTAKLNKIATMLGIGKGKLYKEGDGPFSQRDISNWSALEAKYSLATLLARPKGMTANMFGGTLNTGISAGFGPLLRAQKVTDFSRLHPEFKNMGDVHQWVMDLGVVEDMFLYELEGSKWAGHKKMQGFIADVAKKLQKDPDMSDVTLRDIAKRHELSEGMFNFAGSFMRVAERKLRIDSFLAHYLQQVDNLSPAIGGGSAHSVLQYDSPMLIELAKKGVKATQFLYSAPFRPMFATSALGKVMTRFQMYAYNSVDFRRNIIREAATYGFQEGTKEYDRFKRLLVADMLSIAAANAFVYSIFDNNLPAPWNWIQDFAQWLFGDEKERDRAFYGVFPAPIAPIQAFTPPAFRLVGPVVKGMIDNDFSRVSQYTIWTMFPFGPLAMDVKRSIENPMMVVDKMTGFPLRALANMSKQETDSKTGAVTKKEKKPKEEEKKPKKVAVQNNNYFMPVAPVY